MACPYEGFFTASFAVGHIMTPAQAGFRACLTVILTLMGGRGKGDTITLTTGYTPAAESVLRFLIPDEPQY
jgi:hypothetical protein